MSTDLKYCYVTGGKNNLNFHAWLNYITIEKLITEGCKVVYNQEDLISIDNHNEDEEFLNCRD